MEIVSYRELKPKEDFMMLMEQAFWWPISPKAMAERMKTDIRLKDSPVGFCTVERDQIIGFVGVMDIPTKTASGEIEIIGGVWAVATNPAFVRRGICRTLMEKALQYFRSQDYNFSFLCTGRTIIAYAIYREMGYEEIEAVNELKAVCKAIDKPKPEVKKASLHLDPEKIYRIYEQFAEDKTGFVVRQKDFVTMYGKWKRFDDKISILKTNGYALLSESQNVIRVRDIVALDYNTYGELIDQTERLSLNGVINGSVADETLVDLYQSKGYQVQKGHHGVLMVKNLKDAQIDKVYGSSFYIGALDWF